MADMQRLQPGTFRVRAWHVGDPLDVLIRAVIVGLALATGAIHLALGGLLFTLNGIGYIVAAVAMVIPLAIAIRQRGLIRLGLIGYAAVTIVGWALDGPRYETAYIAKAIEAALIGFLVLDLVRHEGSPVAVVRRAVAELRPALRRLSPQR